MIKKIITDDRLGECCISALHPSGLKILICPKTEFATAYALFGTKYGSIDTRFRIKGEEEYTDVPEGIAHFLEHKLFESEEGDAFTRFSATGGYANAYTSFDRTCYLFSCTERFEENLDILLDFVRHPYFTEATVQKEQGIIGQEIRMYDDDPAWCCFFNLLCSMYSNHPVRIDIAGTVESIAQINADLLYKCYNTFYNPSNMFLCVAGNVDPDYILDAVDKALAGVEGVEIERGTFEEQKGVLRAKVEKEMPVAMPLFNIGFKEDCTPPVKTLKEKIESDILLEMLAGKSSKLYNSLLEEGLVNDRFEASYFTGHGYAVEIFEGESNEPYKVADAIVNEIARLRKEGINEEDFIRAKNALYGRNIMLYNSIERVASSLVSAVMEGYAPFDVQKTFEATTLEDITDRLALQLEPERMAISVINPVKA